MKRLYSSTSDDGARDKPKIACGAPGAQRADERAVNDLLSDSFPLSRSESEWLLTLLSADELRFIFEGPDHVEDKD